MNKKPIRVLLVEDSPVALMIFKRLLGSTPEIEIVGTAKTGIEGLELIPQVHPQVICTDLNMPKMDGLEFTKEVMAKFPCPILVVSSSVQAEDTLTVFNLLKAGAVDVFPKPRQGVMGNFDAIRHELISKIKVLAGVTVFTLHRRGAANRETQRVSPRVVPPKNTGKILIPEQKRVDPVVQTVKIPASYSPAPPVPAALSPNLPTGAGSFQGVKIVAIGASTGGPQALHTILCQLPPKFPVPVICVQHISEGFLKGLVDWLGSECQLPVKIAPAGERPEPGIIYFPPEQKHLEFDSQGRFLYSSMGPVSGHRPSVTVTFNAVAKFYRRAALGILLTGMGRDGADGMLELFKQGGITIAQNESSCVVFGMPREAIALSAAQYILPISEIAPLLLKRLMSDRH
ncbi:chemotaxis-specific protein-glutamate methyltransferase CheB [Oscillatoria acuminata]|uniref:Protein-glutamate methylesterase/protein-glutamine glutaminase n=1 Tax=Oscillatoria acuminata PCC 6304 TaxID=56110 RepID=K9TGK1_9CYAN|nr:chemotaxis-specific protein-glutamate methyltransferase CheB [Oscillatoria acuminata]AFY81992.1 chemotaxis response regulator containing a CheY-like receiver domain and a methylesterase domain [Oscillatoria acuminata PCC 6304]